MIMPFSLIDLTELYSYIYLLELSYHATPTVDHSYSNIIYMHYLQQQLHRNLKQNIPNTDESRINKKKTLIIKKRSSRANPAKHGVRRRHYKCRRRSNPRTATGCKIFVWGQPLFTI